MIQSYTERCMSANLQSFHLCSVTFLCPENMKNTSGSNLGILSDDHAVKTDGSENVSRKLYLFYKVISF